MASLSKRFDDRIEWYLRKHILRHISPYITDDVSERPEADQVQDPDLESLKKDVHALQARAIMSEPDPARDLIDGYYDESEVRESDDVGPEGDNLSVIDGVPSGRCCSGLVLDRRRIVTTPTGAMIDMQADKVDISSKVETVSVPQYVRLSDGSAIRGIPLFAEHYTENSPENAHDPKLEVYGLRRVKDFPIPVRYTGTPYTWGAPNGNGNLEPTWMLIDSAFGSDADPNWVRNATDPFLRSTPFVEVHPWVIITSEYAQFEEENADLIVRSYTSGPVPIPGSARIYALDADKVALAYHLTGYHTINYEQRVMDACHCSIRYERGSFEQPFYWDGALLFMPIASLADLNQIVSKYRSLGLMWERYWGAIRKAQEDMEKAFQQAAAAQAAAKLMPIINAQSAFARNNLDPMFEAIKQGAEAAAASANAELLRVNQGVDSAMDKWIDISADAVASLFDPIPYYELTNGAVYTKPPRNFASTSNGGNNIATVGATATMVWSPSSNVNASREVKEFLARELGKGVTGYEIRQTAYGITYYFQYSPEFYDAYGMSAAQAFSATLPPGEYVQSVRNVNPK
jgi:hypothetical protein